MCHSKPNYFSISQLNKFMACQLAYKFYYREGVKFPPSHQLVVGSAIHKGFELALKEIFNLGGFNIDTVIEEAQVEFERLWVNGVNDPEKEEEARQKFEHLRFFLENWPFPEKTEIVAVENRVEIDGIVAYPDLVLRNEIIDFKTTARTPSEVSRSHFLQIGFYRKVMNVDKARLVYLVLTKKPKIVERYFDKAEMDLAEKLVDDAIFMAKTSIQEADATGLWLPTGIAGFTCSYCEFAKYEICEFGQKIEIGGKDGQKS